MKATKEFFENVQLLTNVADLMLEVSNGVRIPQVCFARALRTVIKPDIKEVIRHSTNEELVHEILQMIYELIINTPIDADWVVSRNNCIPSLTDSEKTEIQLFINKVREVNAR